MADPKSTPKTKKRPSKRQSAAAKSQVETTPKVDGSPQDAHLKIDPALALLEFSSIAAGIQSADAMVKRSQVGVVNLGTVQPGRFLVLLGGEVADVAEALKAGLEIAADALNDHIFLPGVHPDVVNVLAGKRNIITDTHALGIYETYSVPAAIQAADVGIKGAHIELMELRLADGLGGKGVVFFTGKESDVQAAIDLAQSALKDGQTVRAVVIPQLHSDIASVLSTTTRFGSQLNWRF